MDQKDQLFKCSDCVNIVCRTTMPIDAGEKTTERETCILGLVPKWRVCEKSTEKEDKAGWKWMINAKWR